MFVNSLRSPIQLIRCYNLNNKFRVIDAKLNLLANNPKFFETFAQMHRLCLTGQVPVINPKRITCKNTADAITQINLFKHSRFKFIETIEKLEMELQDNEEGTFLLNVYGCDLINNQGWKAPFQGHAFTVIKIIEKGRPSYKFVQSYVDKYNLKDFLEKTNGIYYKNFKALKAQVLKPYYAVLNHEGSWTMKTCNSYKHLTGVRPVYLIGHQPNLNEVTSGKLLERATFGRTTNKEEGFLMGIFKIKEEFNKQQDKSKE